MSGPQSTHWQTISEEKLNASIFSELLVQPKNVQFLAPKYAAKQVNIVEWHLLDSYLSIIIEQ